MIALDGYGTAMSLQNRKQSYRLLQLHEAANGLYAAVAYLKRMLPTFTPADEKNRNLIQQVILPYLDEQLKAATTDEPRVHPWTFLFQ